MMRNTELLRKIYHENKAMNRNMQRLANIGLIGLLGKAIEESTVKGDGQGKLLAKVGLLLIGLSEVLLIIGDFIDYRKIEVEEEQKEFES